MIITYDNQYIISICSYGSSPLVFPLDPVKFYGTPWKIMFFN